MFELPPLIILAVGVVTVVGMIIVLRLNAFVALITAAMLVSVLAPGEIAEKISRVAAAFGNTAGAIGVVIGLAAVIGKCMMDSGAADRIVRSFLGVLGEKRASVALMSSGFVLAVPVFFDTVFYLLVPLARSLWKRTRRDYVKYVLAIGAGGAITHTLVPPTPGPLLMAANLRVDLGLMIMVGAIVALVPAALGVVFAGIANRLMTIPVRDLVEEPQVQTESEDEPVLPSLGMSILPIILPVVLISMDTVTRTLADAEGAALVRPDDLKDARGLCAGLSAVDDRTPGPSRRLAEALPKSVLTDVRAAANDQAAETALAGALNDLLRDRDFYQKRDFRMVDLPPAAEDMLRRGVGSLRPVEIGRLNRLLLEAAFPEHLQPHNWETPRRKAANVTALLGNANLALLISAAIAMAVLYRQRKMTFNELGAAVEIALMSGGVIILITAAGGAFGAMLKAAGIGEAIKEMAGGSHVTGFAMLWLAFGVAALLKIAQGSSTVAMITVSGMFMAMPAEALGFNAVYLATAIGSGSLVGSWMNDSGFWIFAKMSGFTELEALKSWTIMLIVLGFAGLFMTLLLAWLMPLV